MKSTINCNGILHDLTKPKVMGILNLTPDSFYDGGKYKNIKEICNAVENMIKEGVDIIDIGAVSTRPGADLLNFKEEINRLKEPLKEIRKQFPELLISLDTFRSEIAKIAVNDFDVSIINDISAGNMDDKMFETIAELNVPYIIMHMQGTPSNMQKNPKYNNITKDIIKFFSKKTDKLRLLGVNDIIIDPGFGFGKSLEHNYELLNNMDSLKMLDLPIMVGISRKSIINKLLKTKPEYALNGTTVLNTLALEKGANILRVHDVKEANETVKIINKIKKSQNLN